MNYYERHIGDYLKDTAHLSLLEHGVYGRLLDVYYTREGAIPMCQAERLIGVRSREEKVALTAVLEEFFTVEGDDIRHSRCDREIAKFQDKQRKAKASADARWSHRQSHSDGNANASSDAMRTHCEGNAPRARPQTPDTSNHTSPHTPQGGKRSGPVGLKAWMAEVKAKGEKIIPDEDTVFAYATEVGLPGDFLQLAWVEFRHRYTQPDAKRYRDWRSVFRKAVRGNWLKLWFVTPEGAYQLTTVGHQAQRAHQGGKAA